MAKVKVLPQRDRQAKTVYPQIPFRFGLVFGSLTFNSYLVGFLPVQTLTRDHPFYRPFREIGHPLSHSRDSKLQHKDDS